MNYVPVLKSIRLASINYVGYRRYFVTICCFRRQKVFSDPRQCRDVMALLESESAGRCFSVLAYRLMPDHLHFLAEGLDAGSDLLHFLKSFKIKSSRSYALRGRGALWQRGYYEHILRPCEPVESVAWYVWMNPVRTGLVSKAQEYPFSGSFAGMQMPASWGAGDWRPPWKVGR